MLIGCCGWAEGRGKYFKDFPVVELQTTFYQPPSVALAEKWRGEAPADFVFTMKAWQLITHPASSPTYRRLKTPIDAAKADRYGHFRPTEDVWTAWQQTGAIARAVRAAVVVFQCPAGFTSTDENCANLERFFRRVDRGPWLAAWEPRGRWDPDLVRKLCQKLDLIHCLDPFAAEPAHGEAVYFRLHGRGGYRYRYTDDELAELSQICQRHRDAGRAPPYVMFNNVYMRDDARRFRKIMDAAR